MSREIVVDPQKLAAAWGYQVVPMKRGSAASIRLRGVIWVDGDASREDQLVQTAVELAHVALAMAGVSRPSEAAVVTVASYLLSPPHCCDLPAGALAAG